MPPYVKKMFSMVSRTRAEGAPMAASVGPTPPAASVGNITPSLLPPLPMTVVMEPRRGSSMRMRLLPVSAM